MDWFPMQYWRSRCPEIVRVSSETARTKHEVLGFVCDFWSWVSSESADGSVRGVFVRDLPDTLGADAQLWSALVAVGWIAEDECGIVVPGWDNWLSESSKKRAKDAQRKKNSRKAASAKCPKSVRDLSAKRPRSVRDSSAKSVTTVQDSTGQNRTKDKTPHTPRGAGGAVVESVAVVVPPELDTDEFRAAWGKWKAERAAKRIKPYTPDGEREQFRNLAPFGPAVAIAAIRHSIAQGWQGLFPHKVPKSVALPTSAAPKETALERATRVAREAAAQTPPMESQACPQSLPPAPSGLFDGPESTPPASESPTT